MVCSCMKVWAVLILMDTSRARVATSLDNKKCSLDMIWSKDGNEECAHYLTTARSVVNTDLRFISGGSNYLIDLCLHAMTHA